MNPKPPCIALFDLDHTLLPIDSDHEWGRFLARLGVVDPLYYQQENERFYRAYKEGTLDIYAFLQFALKPLKDHQKSTLDQWHEQFMSEVIEPQIRKEAIGLVNHHLVKGDICCIVTATNSFVTRPIAKRFGIDHLIATEPETVLLQDEIQFTGRVHGAPNFKEGKVVHVQNWLRKLGYEWQSLQESIFYSDSMNDLPLLQQVKTPVATNPDERLRAHATSNQWQILDLFA